MLLAGPYWFRRPKHWYSHLLIVKIEGHKYGIILQQFCFLFFCQVFSPICFLISCTILPPHLCIFTLQKVAKIIRKTILLVKFCWVPNHKFDKTHQRPYFKSVCVQARSQLGMNFSIVFLISFLVKVGRLHQAFVKANDGTKYVIQFYPKN